MLNVKDARRASEFWSQALGYTCVAAATIARTPRPCWSRPRRWRSRSALDEADVTHLDLHTDSAQERQAEVERLISLGATRVDWTYPDGARFIVLADPEGNLFCVVNLGG